MSDQDQEAKRTTFFSKNPIVCPVCETSFYKEDLLSGGGRLIAGELTEELHRTYEPSKKYGELFPLVYAVLVCPSCFYAVYPQDFLEIKEEFIEALRGQTDRRVESVSLVFKDLDFTSYRGLKEGAASYFLAMMCYDHLDRHYSPTLKRALSALRAAWLLDSLHRKDFSENYDYLSRLFYRKARFFYMQAIEMAQNGQEPLEVNVNFGPDLDKNYGYDGLLYVAGLLEYKYGPRKNTEKRIKSLENAKRIVSKLFGTGKASKSKPSAILDKARELYDEMNKEIKQLQGQD
ncbi:MAG: DUF2225 domain-containing protein [Spirochaetaceae bacterium]|nr:MAG: DUF2225 domain-containing protein [Spirochaetaceae bacterium]